jgi:FlaG/FlaF family flagellin (archaellin)
MLNTSLKDLLVSAQAAALKACAASDVLSQQTIKLEEFATANLDRADYPTWETAFNAQLDTLTAFAKQDSPATLAAKRAASAAAAPHS